MSFATTSVPQWIHDIASPGQGGHTAAAPPATAFVPSDEQADVIDTAAEGRDIVVNATVGSGKTSTITALCETIGRDREVLYLTYSKLLKADAKAKVRRARVQNYHGVVYPSLKAAGINVGVSASVGAFNANFSSLKTTFPRYDTIVIDEYQDITEEYARLIANIKSLNPAMQVIMVGDPEQRIHANSSLDAQRFAAEITHDAARLPMTRSFRMGPLMGDLLAEAWNKPVIGANRDQVVRVLDQSEAVHYLTQLDPSQVLVLGKRSGGTLSSALNSVEYLRPDKFNKNTVFASIKERGDLSGYDQDNAIFTTFDSSKGLERPVAFVYDMNENYFDNRLNQAGAIPEIVRNNFLVAASRGKAEIVFVSREPNRASRWREISQAADLDEARQVISGTILEPDDLDEPMIGSIPVTRFLDLPELRKPQYRTAMDPSQCFDHTYAENLVDAFDLVGREPLAEAGEPIEVPGLDGLIDLAPVIDAYVPLMYFTRAKVENFSLGSMEDSDIARYRRMLRQRTRDKQRTTWNDALFLTAVRTDQERYLLQVDKTITDEHDQAIIDRLEPLLPRDARAQVLQETEGRAIDTIDPAQWAKLAFAGRIDALYNKIPWILRFSAELSREAFLEAALHQVIGGYEAAVLMNVRTGERWRVTVPDHQQFMDAVVTCSTRQAYQRWRRS